MNKKKILLSLLTIVAVAGVAFGVTQAYFFDEEKSEGNVLGAGTIDISVDDQNPWKETYFDNTLEDMKPCETKWMEFKIKNEGKNPAKVWKHVKINSQDGGEPLYDCTCGVGSDVMVSSEPECYEGTNGCTTAYVARDNIASYIVYDLWVDMIGDGQAGWYLISEDDEVRLDNVSCSWIYLGELQPDQEMTVKQSYHLMAWTDAAEDEITNWAQGDEVNFDIELYAEQTSGSGPGGAQGTLALLAKDGTTWIPGGATGTLTYNTSGSIFDYDFSAQGLKSDTSYCLIYYADPWPGIGGFEIECKSTNSGETMLNMSLAGKDIVSIPVAGDNNHPAGAKIWLVLDDDYDEAADKMIGWSPDDYLFEKNLITYEKTGT